MLSKFGRVAKVSSPMLLSLKEKRQVISTRVMSHMVPPNQYDMPWPKRLNLLYVVREYWETIPLFFCTSVAMGFLFFSVYWACNNKVDVVFSTRSRENISRTMDLRNPTVHKIILINQRYTLWTEMQDALDKMKAAEKRALARAQTCAAK